jgi:hypothetical protein
MTYPDGQQPAQNPGQGNVPPQGPAQPPQPGFTGGQPQQGQPQQGYPQQGQPQQGYQQGYPQQGYPQNHPPQGYPPQGYAPQGYQQPGYPQQPGNPNAPQQGWAPGQANPAPFTSPGLGAGPAILGVVIVLVSLFLVPWVNHETFIDLLQQASGNSSFAAMYVKFLGFLAAAASAYSVLPWTLGALRTKKSAYWLSGIRSRELTQSNFWWYRAVFAGRATVMLVIHLAGIFTIYDGNFELFGIGPVLLIVGTLVMIGGAVIGPQKSPTLAP